MQEVSVLDVRGKRQRIILQGKPTQLRMGLKNRSTQYATARVRAGVLKVEGEGKTSTPTLQVHVSCLTGSFKKMPPQESVENLTSLYHLLMAENRSNFSPSFLEAQICILVAYAPSGETVVVLIILPGTRRYNQRNYNVSEGWGYIETHYNLSAQGPIPDKSLPLPNQVEST